MNTSPRDGWGPSSNLPRAADQPPRNNPAYGYVNALSLRQTTLNQKILYTDSDVVQRHKLLNRRHRLAQYCLLLERHSTQTILPMALVYQHLQACPSTANP